jgi:hypothetical protein
MATPIAGDPDVVTPAVMSAIADSKEIRRRGLRDCE